MELATASAVVHYATELEEASAVLYERLAKKYAEASDMFLALAKENRKNKADIERAYYGVISDKLEACFIKILNTDNYMIKTQLPEDISYSDALKKIIKMEEEIRRFLLEASDAIGVLVPDVSWVFTRIGKRRGERVNKLKAKLG